MVDQKTSRFDFFQPTKLYFGTGRIATAGETAASIGKNALLVRGPGANKYIPEGLAGIRDALKRAGVGFEEFDKVQPNPVIGDVQEGAAHAKDMKADVVVGMGGGSVMDTARAIAVAATHEGTAMDYLYFSETQPTDKTLPMLMIPTTSGTGSHMSCCAVITDPERNFKSALWNRERLFARAAIVDPELTIAAPGPLTAGAGFDVFAHAFESYININASPYTDLLALEAIRLAREYLPRVIDDLRNIGHRARMAWADTMAGICISNSGTTLPHAMGQPISGHFPHVSHGESLAVIYPQFLEYTCEAASPRFAAVARVFNPSLDTCPESEAAEALAGEVRGFLEHIGLARTLNDFGIKPGDIDGILKHCMEFPDVEVNPAVPDADKVRRLYMRSFQNGE